jgi:methylmalonyl-CoA mutase
MIKHFEKVGKERWLEKIRKDLKGADSHDFFWIINNRIRIDPFLHSSDFGADHSYPGKSADLNSWKSALMFPAISLQPNNKHLLESLNHGLEKPIIQVDQSGRSLKWPLILKDVILEYIELCIEIPEKTKTEIIAELSSTVPLEQHKFINLRSRSLLPNEGAFKTELLIEENSSRDVDVALAEILTIGFTFLSENPENSTIVRLQSSNSFLLEIAKIRAMNILWANMMQELKGTIEQANIEVWVSQKNYTEDPYQNLYIGSTLALSATIGGAESIIIDRPDIHTEEKLNSSNQLALNIHHMLRQESYLDRVVDPACGSYSIEKLTEEIAESAWNIFGSRI